MFRFNSNNDLFCVSKIALFIGVFFFTGVNSFSLAECLYSFPLTPGPLSLLQGFDENFTHKGNLRYALDFKVPIGTDIFASRSGIVSKVQDKFGEGKNDISFLDKANYIVIDHLDGTFSFYAHLKKGKIFVRPGEKVLRHDLIGQSGRSGMIDGAHLHFEVFRYLNLKEKSRKSLAFKMTTGKITYSSFKKGMRIENLWPVNYRCR